VSRLRQNSGACRERVHPVTCHKISFSTIEWELKLPNLETQVSFGTFHSVFTFHEITPFFNGSGDTMADKNWVLTDVDQGIHLETFVMKGDDLVPGSPKCSVEKRTLRGGLSDGVDVVEVNNGRCRFSILPTRGMGIWKARSGDLPIGWISPVKGPVHPQHVPLMEPSGLGFLDGFDEMMVRCGLESNGAPEFNDQGRLLYTLHGRIANRPAHFVDVSTSATTGEISVKGIVDETRFHFLKLRLTSTVVTKPGEPGFRIQDQIENLSESPAEAQILYHANYGPPLLDAGARLVAPVKTVVPRDQEAADNIANWDNYAAPQADFREQVYFFELVADAQGSTQVLLKNAHALQGVSMAFNIQQLPCFSVWKNTTAEADGTVTGIEPATNFPNPRTFEGKHGRIVPLPPRGVANFEVDFAFHETADEVANVESEIAKLQQSVQPNICAQPRKDWSGEPPPL